MPQTSKYPLDRETEKAMFRKFWLSLSSLRDSDTVASFFTDFLSETEKLMLAKRFTIAVLLLRGRRPTDIKRILHVSNSATGSAASWLKNAKPKTLATLERVIQENQWEQFIDSIESAIDSLPLRYGSNWGRVKKEKAERELNRGSREVLR